VRLSALGQRDMDTGAVPIDDPVELAHVRRQARKVHVQSVAVALLLTAVAVVV
jgi:hypothetical protein